MSEFQDLVAARVRYLRSLGKLAEAARLEEAGRKISELVDGLPEPEEA